MKYAIIAAAVLTAVLGAPTSTRASDSKAIDTKKLVVKPTKAIADLTAKTINLAGNAAAGQIESSGYIKTLNNLFRKPTPTTVQNGPSALPVPHLYPSTQYPNYNVPVMPRSMPVRR